MLFKVYQFIQLIKEPTRIVERSSTLLDLAFTTDQGKISDSGVLECSISDHSLVYIIRKARPPRGPIKPSNVGVIRITQYQILSEIYTLPLGMSLTPLSRSMRRGLLSKTYLSPLLIDMHQRAQEEFVLTRSLG